MVLSLMEFIFLMMTIGLYMAGIQLYKKKKHPFTIPIVTATVAIIILLISFNIPYDRYMEGAKWIDKLLGPAVVALAYPLYINRSLLKRYSYPLIISIFTGVCIGVFSGLLLAKMIGTSLNVVLSLLPKSVTTPVAMEIVKVSGGTPSLSVVFVMVAGIGGVMLAPYLFRWFNINDDMSKGLGLGAASHAIGTSKALEYGSLAGAISSVAMTISAIVASILIPIVSSWI